MGAVLALLLARPILGGNAEPPLEGVTPHTFHETFDFQQSLVAPSGGKYAGKLISEDLIREFFDVSGPVVGQFPAGIGRPSQSYDDRDGWHLLGNTGSHAAVSSGDSFGNPISNVTAIGVYASITCFANANGDLGIRDMLTGETTAYPGFFGFGVGGMDIDASSGTPVLYAGRFDLPQFSAFGMCGDLFDGFEPQLLARYHVNLMTGGITGLTVDGSEYRAQSVDGIAAGNDLPAPPKDGDANGDGVVDVNDISYVLFRLGEGGPNGDANGDGTVDVNDISYVLFRLGNPCP